MVSTQLYGNRKQCGKLILEFASELGFSPTMHISKIDFEASSRELFQKNKNASWIRILNTSTETKARVIPHLVDFLV